MSTNNDVALYALREPKSGFMDPVTFPTEVAAKAAFRGSCYSLGINGAMWEEYELYRLGMYDVEEGSISPCVPAVFICSARSFGLAEDIAHARQVYLDSSEVSSDA